jgi:uncharacterized protein (DUF1697 family)
MARLIALVRGINVGSTRKLPMADLRTACAETGLGEVQTYIQSGNLILDHADPAKAEAALEALIADRFGLDVPVIARTAAQWAELVATCPLPDEARDAPRALHLLLCKKPPAKDAIAALRDRAKHGETITRWGPEIAIHFTNGVADSKLAPTLIDRLIGSPATARNWNTVLKLDEMAKA